jgi:hypothetical protein
MIYSSCLRKEILQKYRIWHGLFTKLIPRSLKKFEDPIRGLAYQSLLAYGLSLQSGALTGPQFPQAFPTGGSVAV